MNLRSASTTAALFALACGFVCLRVGLGASDDPVHVDTWVVWATALCSVWACSAALGRFQHTS